MCETSVLVTTSSCCLVIELRGRVSLNSSSSAELFYLGMFLLFHKVQAEVSTSSCPMLMVLQGSSLTKQPLAGLNLAM